jgi:hypothetical protein
LSRLRRGQSASTLHVGRRISDWILWWGITATEFGGVVRKGKRVIVAKLVNNTKRTVAVTLITHSGFCNAGI